ncbi:MAG: sulfatase/phosphatase domain-containing protein, partial [Dysgonamonadaceae bacterium]
MKQLSVLLFGCSLLTGCSHGNGEETSLGRPNIIFILTDDQRWDALGYAGNKIIRTPEMDKLAKEVREGYNRTRWYWRYDTPAKYQHSMKGYYRMISEVDDEIGEIRKLLEEKEIADNTVIIFMGDNGYFVGERQLAGKWLMYENSIRVPLMIYDPRAGQHFDIEDMILNIDIASTILDLAGIELPEPYQGFSLMPYVIDGKHDEKRETILIEHLWELPQIPSSEGIRSDRWKYFRYRFIDAPEELYDLDNDPLEIHNLATDPKYDKVLQIFRKELKYRINQYYNAKLVSDFVPPE